MVKRVGGAITTAMLLVGLALIIAGHVTFGLIVVAASFGPTLLCFSVAAGALLYVVVKRKRGHD